MTTIIVSTNSAGTTKTNIRSRHIFHHLHSGYGELACCDFDFLGSQHARGLAALVGKSQRDEAMERFRVFKTWFLDHIMAASKRNTLVILPIENLEPRYRDEPQHPPVNPPTGLSNLFISPSLGAPELVVPGSLYSDLQSRESTLTRDSWTLVLSFSHHGAARSTPNSSVRHGFPRHGHTLGRFDPNIFD